MASVPRPLKGLISWICQCELEGVRALRKASQCASHTYAATPATLLLPLRIGMNLSRYSAYQVSCLLVPALADRPSSVLNLPGCGASQTEPRRQPAAVRLMSAEHASAFVCPDCGSEALLAWRPGLTPSIPIGLQAFAQCMSHKEHTAHLACCKCVQGRKARLNTLPYSPMCKIEKAPQ